MYFRCIPEFVTENLVSYLSFLRRFSPRTLEEQGYNALAPILTTVLIFMGSPERMRNPHMRARLAECLEAMLPHHKDEPQGLNNLGGSQRERLFLEHPHHSEVCFFFKLKNINHLFRKMVLILDCSKFIRCICKY